MTEPSELLRVPAFADLPEAFLTDRDRVAALRASDVPLLRQRRENHVFEGFTVPQRVPGTLLEHAIGDLTG